VKIFVSRKIPQSGIDLLKKKHTVKVSIKDRVLSKRELIANAKDADALLCLLTDKIDKKVIDSCPKLKIISNYAVGFDNIDFIYAQSKGIIVTNTPGVLSETVAEHTVALIFATSMRISEADRYTRKGKYKSWEPMLLLGQDIHDKTLGIVGAGRIGSLVMKYCMAMGMKVVYHDIKRNKKFDRKGAKYKKSLDSLLKIADIITIHVPLLKSTHHLFSKKQFKIMKKNAILINTSRGPVINEVELAYALKKGEIFAAGLDVYEFEPKINSKLKKLENVILAPHIASASIETRTAMSELAAKNILAVLAGKKAITRI